MVEVRDDKKWCWLRPELGFADEGLWADERWEVRWRTEQKFCFDHVKFEVAFEHLSGAISLEV